MVEPKKARRIENKGQLVILLCLFGGGGWVLCTSESIFVRKEKEEAGILVLTTEVFFNNGHHSCDGSLGMNPFGVSQLLNDQADVGPEDRCRNTL